LPRYVSRIRNYEFTGQHSITHETTHISGLPPRRSIVCKFKHAGLSPWEIDAALNRFKFPAAGHDEKVSHRLSFFDTEIESQLQNWTPDERTLIESRLESAPGNGVDFIRVDKPVPVAPWPAYPKLVAKKGQPMEKVAEKIVAIVGDMGLDPGAVAQYERETLNRPQVLEALDSIVPKEEEDEPLVAA
jgi:hypothetical protein